MSMSYEKYKKSYACDECGSEPDYESYVEWLRREVDRLQKIVDMTPEEKAEWDKEQKLTREFTRHIVSQLFYDLQPGSTVHAFGKVADK